MMKRTLGMGLCLLLSGCGLVTRFAEVITPGPAAQEHMRAVLERCVPGSALTPAGELICTAHLVGAAAGLVELVFVGGSPEHRRVAEWHASGEAAGRLVAVRVTDATTTAREVPRRFLVEAMQ